MKLQKLGGYAAIASQCFLAIFAIMEIPVADLMDAEKAMAVSSATPAHSIVLFIIVGIIAVICLFVMFLALHERMQADAPYLTLIMLIAASAVVIVGITMLLFTLGGRNIIVPAQDVSALRALTAIGLSMAVMVHHTLGWAYLLLGCAILKTRAFSRILGGMFLFVGVVGITTSIVPQLQLKVISMLHVISTLLWVVATVWIGIALIRQKQPESTLREMAASN